MASTLAIQMLLLALAGPTADLALVPVVRPDALEARRASQLAAQVGEVLAEAGLVVVPAFPLLPEPLVTREGGATADASVAYAGKLQGATLALRIEGGQLGDRLVIALEALSSETGEKVASKTLTATAGEDPSAWKEPLAAFIAQLQEVTAQHPLQAAVAQSSTPAPPERPAALTPQSPPEPPALAAAPSRGHLVPLAVGVALLGGSAFAFASAHDRYRTLAGDSPPTLPQAEAQRIALEGQSLQSLGIAGAVAGAGAVVGGLAWWALGSQAAPPPLAWGVGPGGVFARGRF